MSKIHTVSEIFQNTLTQIGSDAADAMLDHATKELSERFEFVKEKVDGRISDLKTDADKNSKSDIESKCLSKDLDEIDKAIEERELRELECIQPDFVWRNIASHLRSACLNVLDIGIDTILCEALSNWQELKNLADPEETSPEEIHIVPLARHTIETGYAPHVDIEFHGISIARIDFDILIQLFVDGLNLVIQGGKIHEIRLSRLQFGGIVSIEGSTIIEQPVFALDFPGVLKLNNPMPIRFGNIENNTDYLAIA